MNFVKLPTAAVGLFETGIKINNTNSMISRFDKPSQVILLDEMWVGPDLEFVGAWGEKSKKSDKFLSADESNESNESNDNFNV